MSPNRQVNKLFHLASPVKCCLFNYIDRWWCFVHSPTQTLLSKFQLYRLNFRVEIQLWLVSVHYHMLFIMGRCYRVFSFYRISNNNKDVLLHNYVNIYKYFVVLVCLFDFLVFGLVSDRLETDGNATPAM